MSYGEWALFLDFASLMQLVHLIHSVFWIIGE